MGETTALGWIANGEAEADGTGMFGEAALRVTFVSDGDNGAVDAVNTGQAGEFVERAEDVDAIDLAAVEFDVVVDDAGEGADAGAFHEFEEDPCLAARTVHNDCHRSPAFERHHRRTRVSIDNPEDNRM